MDCPHCVGTNTTKIEIRLKGDESVRFFSCRTCEHKWWKYESDDIALPDVLTLTAEREPARN